MSAFSAAIENAILSAIFRGVEYIAPERVYVALFNGAPEATGEEVSGHGYARAPASFGAPTSRGLITNSVDVTFPVASGSWGTVSHFAIFDRSTGGTMLVSGEFSERVPVGNRFVFKLPAGELEIAFDKSARAR